VLIRILDKLWKGVRYATFLLLRPTVLGNRELFYSRFFGCDHPALLLLKNLLNPVRFANKVRYGCVPLLPPSLRKGEPAPAGTVTAQAIEQASLLREQGYLIFDGARPDMAEHLLRRYSRFMASITPADHYFDLFLREVDQSILAFMTDEKMLGIMAAYYHGRQPFLRETGAIKATWPTADRESTRQWAQSRSKFAVDWHYDTVNMLQIHFLLQDLTEADSHMALVANQARTHRVHLAPDDYAYSDEYIAARYRTVPFVGRKGTVILWDSNAPHAAILRKDKPRLFMQMLYTPGNDILTLDPKFGMDMGLAVEGLDLQALSPISRNALKYIIDERPRAQHPRSAGRAQGVSFATSE
jgi:hypothetical protein